MIGTLLSSQYRLDAELGRGEMGIVYRAYDMLLDRDVVVKVLGERLPDLASLPLRKRGQGEGQIKGSGGWHRLQECNRNGLYKGRRVGRYGQNVADRRPRQDIEHYLPKFV